MLLDLYTQRNFININVKLIHIVGLQASVYLTELMTISEKAIKKGKLVEGKYLYLNREYIFSRTSITIEEQLNIDNSLMKIGLIQKNGAGEDYIFLDSKLLTELLISEDKDKLKGMSDLVRNAPEPKSDKSKKESLISSLKRYVTCSNPELAKALYDWVESACRKTGPMTKVVIEQFQKTLNDYAKGDLAKALSIVNIATIQGYRDCKWAINIYERDNRIVSNRFDSFVSSKPKTSEQTKATKLADIEF